jgi:hypothetical protein
MSTTAPDERFTTYSPSVATTDFPTLFPIFANNDLSVYVDGAERSDFTVTATYVDGVSNDAKVIMDSGVTGSVVVVGNRDPRRQNRFGAGAMPVRDVNLAFDTIEGEMQEARRDINRSHKAPFGSEGGVFSAEDIGNAQSYAEIALAAAQQAQLFAYGVIPNRAALKAVDTTKQQYATISQEGGRNGSFVWQSGNYSAQVAADTSEGIYIKADAVPASLGAWVRVLGDSVNVAWFGASGDGIVDEIDSFTAAKAAAVSLKKKIHIPGGVHKISSPWSLGDAVGLVVEGDGIKATQLIPAGNFSAVMTFNSSSAYITVSDLTIYTSGTTTQCAILGVDATVIRFSKCEFDGDLTGDLVYSNGQNVDFDKCSWYLRSRNTWGINFDTYNQNGGVTDCRFGGPGSGVRITHTLTPGSNRVEGIKFTGSYWINTGPYNIDVGDSLLTTITGCVLDQATDSSLIIRAGAQMVAVSNSWLGLRYMLDGTPVITRSGSVATATMPSPHFLTTGKTVRIAGAAQPEYNGNFSVTVTGPNSFTFNVTGSPASPATGAISVRRPGQPVFINPDAGNSHEFDNCKFHCGDNGVVASGSAINRVNGLSITNCHFYEAYSSSLQLDSALNCVIADNIDFGSPANGSWITSGTFAGGGDYQFSNNKWYPHSPAVFHAGSAYKWNNDSGIVGNTRGVSPALGGAASAVVIPHGIDPVIAAALGVHATVTARNIEAVDSYVTNFNASNFTVGIAISSINHRFDYTAWCGN